MFVGIVGSEAAKFTRETEAAARELIRSLLSSGDVVVSGHCHLGGIDLWAEEEAGRLGLDTKIYPPRTLSWETGYRPRNLQIARTADYVACITVREYHAGYAGMRFDHCYHCNTNEHIKSGGCWTVKKARQMGKFGEVFTV